MVETASQFLEIPFPHKRNAFWLCLSRARFATFEIQEGHAKLSVRITAPRKLFKGYIVVQGVLISFCSGIQAHSNHVVWPYEDSARSEGTLDIRLCYIFIQRLLHNGH